MRDGTLWVLTLRVLHKFLFKKLELSPLMHDSWLMFSVAFFERRKKRKKKEKKGKKKATTTATLNHSSRHT